MAHNVYIKPGGNWNNGDKFDHTEIELLDEQLFRAIDGDTGGSWAPSSPIVIAGQGLDPTLKAGKWPNFLADPGFSRTFVRLLDLAIGQALPGGTFDNASSNLTPGMRGTIGMGDPVVLVAMRPTSVPNGSTLTQVDVLLHVASGHADVPQTLPKVRVFRVANANLEQADLRSGLPQGGKLEMPRPAPNTAGQYEANGADGVQEFSYVCDQNNAIDHSAFTYYALIDDEGGVNGQPGNLFYALRLTFTATNLQVP